MSNLRRGWGRKAGVDLVLVFAVIVLGSWVSAGSLTKSFQKKINKTLVELWDGEPQLSNFSLEDSSKVKFEKLGVQGVFEVLESNQKMGFAVLAKARSKFENFDYIVYYDQTKTIKAVRVLLYREDYGGEIASKRWLKQFNGKTAQSPIAIDEDIQGISGATISYRAITAGVKEITLLMQTL